MTTILTNQFRVMTRRPGAELDEMFTITADDRAHALWIAERCLPRWEIKAAFQVVEVA